MIDCWIWTGSQNGVGYGTTSKGILAHRVAYEFLVGPIPPGLQIDHLCRNTICCNPAHLEPVTPKENVNRGNAMFVNGARQAAKTHCPLGHPYSHSSHGQRHCKPCRSLAEARYRQKRKETK